MIGGMVSLLTLIVIPAIEGAGNAFRLRQANHTATLPSLSLMMK
jgi:hypothetical protein